VHTIGEKEPIEIPDTGAGNRDIRDPTFSPDGRYIAYWAQGVVKKTTPDGTMASEFGKAPSTRGIGWIDNDTLVLGNAQSAMLKLSAGTEPVPLVNTTGTTMPQVSPHVLPGNKAILFTMASGDLLNARIRVLILDTGEERQLLDTNAFAPRYLPSGHIVFARGATRELMAVRFDLSTLKVVGSPQLVLNVPLLGSGISGTDYAVSETGVLVYTPYREAGSDTLIGWFGDPTKIHVRLNWSVP
jgi:serine/threonine-protein kinase